MLEQLEPRRLLAETNLGVLVGRQYFQDSIDKDIEFRDRFFFTLDPTRPTQIFQTQFSPDDTGGSMDLRVGTYADCFGECFTDVVTERDHGSFDYRLPTGDYMAEVTSSGIVTGYRLALASDLADGHRGGDFGNGGAILPGTPDDFVEYGGHDLGLLSTVTPKTVRDFIGYLDTSARPGKDLIDHYFLELPVFGTVNITLDELVNDVAGGSVAADLKLYRDIDSNDVLEPDEVLSSRTATVGQPKTIQQQLNAGNYHVIVSRLGTGSNLGGSNYRLNVSYSVPDNAGNTAAAARMVSVGNNAQLFTDYLSSVDPADIYRFETVGDGPWVFNAQLTGLPENAVFNVDLIQDGNHDGIFDQRDAIIIPTAGSTGQNFTVNVTAAGTYYIRVLHGSGEGAYTLSASNRNSDLAGSSLAPGGFFTLPFGLAGYEARARVSDYLTATDTADIFGLTITHGGTLSASIGSTAINNVAGAEIIRDLDQDQAIDNADILASSPTFSNGPKTVSIAATPGTYFVRVFRASGSPYYELTTNLDTAGSTTATARQIILDGSIEDNVFEFVGPGDATDYFVFNLGQAQRVSIGLGFVSRQITVELGQDVNGNGVLEVGEIALKYVPANLRTDIKAINLNSSGRYFVKVTPVESAGASYTIQLASSRIDNAGNTLLGARDLGTLSSLHTLNDFVGDGTRDYADDMDDMYRVTLTDRGPFVLQTVLNVSSPTMNDVGLVELIRDDDLNGTIDPGEVVIGPIPAFQGHPGVLVSTLTQPGTYYFHVKRSTGQVFYSLSAIASSLDPIGNTLATATNVGAIDSYTPESTLKLQQFVGAIDRNDTYRFSIATAGELSLTMNSSTENTHLEIIRDLDNDQMIDPGETLVTSAGRDTLATYRLEGVLLLAAGGNYYLRVLSDGGNANYTVDLAFSKQTPFLGKPFSISATEATTIQAEEFDLGGAQEAYFDTSKGNAGGQFRNEDVDIRRLQGGGFYVSDTAAGEFLEYTINVPIAGNYEFEFRVSSSVNGAEFRAEIDSVNFATQSIANTGSDQNMVTVFVPGIPLLAGPHVLKLVMDNSVNSSGPAGNYEFIRITPSVGTFVLTPARITAAVNQHTQLSLAWTVPFGGWRVLNDVDVRFTGASGTALWVRFNEAANTLSLYNFATGKFGPAKKLGTPAVLSSGGARIHLGTSRIQAAGPASPTVELVLDLSFSSASKGRRFSVEVAASDDLGNAQPFKPAGTLVVAEALRPFTASGRRSRR